MKAHKSSFRDPGGFLFYEDGILRRQVNPQCAEDLEMLTSSGLYTKLRDKELLIRHEEIEGHRGKDGNAYKVIEPEIIPFISYPYEWSFSQLKDAALATLSIQTVALKHGMSLKDASGYNIQFRKGIPVFIDTLSFEKYRDGEPWTAYRQFCQHFLAPLALMSYSDIRLNQLLKIYIDGIPLGLAAQLLPLRARFHFPMLMHIFLHAKAQKKYETRGSAAREVKISKANHLALIEGLKSAIRRLKLKTKSTEWGQYYDFTNYSDTSFNSKKEITENFLMEIKPQIVWDLGANTGEFTRLAVRAGAECVAFDIDPLAVEFHYNKIRKEKITDILPLILDLTNPSPAIGWNNKERMNLKSRTKPDTIMALALIHHLAISNNLPLRKIAKFFSKLADNLVIEFIPKEDSQVQKLLESRKDIFPGFTEDLFRQEFAEFFNILEVKHVEGSKRTIYRMKRKERYKP